MWDVAEECKESGGPGWCGSVGGASSGRVKGHQFDSRLQHMPGWLACPRGACERQLINVSLAH